MKKAMLALATLIVSNSAFAVTNSLPANCDYGRHAPYDVEFHQVSSAVSDGLEVFGNPYDLAAWDEFFDSMSDLLDSFDYLRVETPKHVLRGSSFRAKGNLFDKYAYVNFHNSEKGYTGRDKSNLDANSYHYMSFDKTHGYGLIWITRGALCSAEGVWVQNNPSVSGSGLSTSGDLITAKVNYSVDNYSKAAKDSNTPVKLTVTSRSDGYDTRSSKTFTTTRTSGSYTLPISAHAGGGIYDIQVTVHDGNYHRTINMGSTWVQGPSVPPCEGCVEL
ncbi:hypothetical protein [Pseudoalteromonas luteoviolacea]|uniref:Uncharacterized protein n=1 Tax=Pseudoalteromonas luteoviolacea NCIMB 1942 TaxID=1365253 RepID=A0A167C9A9_9GAMM|nr:hypothetical protein [Pseudoalteromonas luteoviolacea]KZN47394.1 hypothetical protein N482_09550 [Pseudoalteromonas luteoviolacea NCIMB 1942]KZW98807.1 hypothetical protein JL49_21140 [Pseudoalteromonas luteoviolacea]